VPLCSQAARSGITDITRAIIAASMRSSSLVDFEAMLVQRCRHVGRCAAISQAEQRYSASS